MSVSFRPELCARRAVGIVAIIWRVGSIHAVLSERAVLGGVV
jgi:hypothetical protein